MKNVQYNFSTRRFVSEKNKFGNLLYACKADTWLNMFEFNFLENEASSKQILFDLAFDLSFAHLITFCRLFIPVECGISHDQVYLINIRTGFSRKLKRECNNFVSYFLVIFAQGITVARFYALSDRTLYTSIVNYRNQNRIVNMLNVSACAFSIICFNIYSEPPWNNISTSTVSRQLISMTSFLFR